MSVKTVEYYNIHNRIKKIKPKPENGKCELCNKVISKEKSTKLELSNKDHLYKLNPDDYQWVHHGCHFRFDYNKKPKIKTNKKMNRIYLNDDSAKELKIIGAQEDKTLQKVFEEAVRFFLKYRKEKK